MALLDDLNADVSNIISKLWDKRKGTTVPSSENVALNGGAVELDATYLYADMANSSKIANTFDRRIAAKILKSFLSTITRLIRKYGGTVISFDGDRVLGVFVGGQKNSSAVKCALQIKYVVDQIIKPKFCNKYDGVKNATFSISHGVGIDTGTVLIVRAGARGANDLISIGRGPNLAAKLSDVRQASYKTFISSTVYNSLMDYAKYGGSNNENMWEKCSYKYLGNDIEVYRSSWHWKP